MQCTPMVLYIRREVLEDMPSGRSQKKSGVGSNRFYRALKSTFNLTNEIAYMYVLRKVEIFNFVNHLIMDEIYRSDELPQVHKYRNIDMVVDMEGYYITVTYLYSRSSIQWTANKRLENTDYTWGSLNKDLLLLLMSMYVKQMHGLTAVFSFEGHKYKEKFYYVLPDSVNL